MSAAEGNMGADTTIVNNGIWSAGAGAHTGFMEFTQNLNASKVSIPVGNPSVDMHSINLGTLLCMVNPTKLKSIGYNSAIVSDNRTFGRPLVIGQSGNLPHGLNQNFMDTPYGKSLDPEDLTKLKIEMSKSYLTFFGVSRGNFELGKKNYTPTVDGIPVIVFGPVTVTLFTPIVIPPLSHLVLDFIQLKTSGRAGNVKYTSQGAERYPFTLTALDPAGTKNWMTTSIRLLQERMMTKSGTFTLQSIDALLKQEHAMLEGERNALSFVTGITSMFIGVLRVMSNANVGASSSAASATAAVSSSVSSTGSAASEDDVEFEKIFPLVIDFLLDPSKGHIPTKLFVNSLISSALGHIMGGVLDTHGKVNKVIGRNMGMQEGSYVKNHGRIFDYDIFLTL